MIDAQVQTELRARFNPEGSMLRKQQLRMLDMLKYIDRVCREQRIPYWLSSGTCLGAVRHGGFIPWDDDVDIEMLHKDYKRFLEYMEHHCDGQYAIQTHKTDPAYLLPYAKLRDRYSEITEDTLDGDYKFKGIFIDIFPSAPSCSKYIALIGKYLFLLCWSTNKITYPRFRSICRSVCCFIVFKLIAPIVCSLMALFSTKYLRLTFGHVYLEKQEYKDIFPLKQISFEGESFSCPGKTDNYLRSLYNNYAQLPDLNRIPRHTTQIKFFEQTDVSIDSQR